MHPVRNINKLIHTDKHTEDICVPSRTDNNFP